jgi:CBS domain-containing protein
MPNASPEAARIRNLGEALKVRRIMSQHVFTVCDRDSLLILMEALEGKNLNHIPVFDEMDAVCAVVTKADLLGFAPSLTSGLSAPEKARVLAKFTVWDLLYARPEQNLVRLKPDDSIAFAAGKMKTAKEDCATVYDEKGALVGIVTEADYVALFAGGTV